MKNRRSFTGWLGAAIFGALVTGIGHAAIADEYPSRPIRILVNTGPGGLIDVTVRLLAENLSENLGQPVIVENRAGGDGIVGILAAKGAAPDGYTLLATAGTIAIQTAVKIDPGYDIATDFAPIGSIMQAPLILMEGADGPDNSFDEFMTRAKASPTEVAYASAGVGSGTHLPAAILFKQANLDILHIPYKGNGPAMPDVMSGRVDVIFEAYSSGGGKLKDGTLKALAVTSAERMPSLPDIPTIAESGYPGFEYYTYAGLLAPAGTPPEVVGRLSEALKLTLAEEDVIARFHEGGGEPLVMEPAEYRTYLLDDAVRMDVLARELGIPKK